MLFKLDPKGISLIYAFIQQYLPFKVGQTDESELLIMVNVHLGNAY